MKLKHIATTLAACTLLTGTAYADFQSSATSGAGGVSASTRNGSVAGGAAASQSRQDRRDARKNARSSSQRHARCVPGTASTSTSGSVYTDRRTGTAGINTNGTASGSGTVRSNSEGEVYSSTDRDGSQADAYGNSTAVSREPTRRC